MKITLTWPVAVVLSTAYAGLVVLAYKGAAPVSAVVGTVTTLVAWLAQSPIVLPEEKKQ